MVDWGVDLGARRQLADAEHHAQPAGAAALQRHEAGPVRHQLPGAAGLTEILNAGLVGDQRQGRRRLGQGVAGRQQLVDQVRRDAGEAGTVRHWYVLGERLGWTNWHRATLGE
jgi:hypothetical protein